MAVRGAITTAVAEYKYQDNKNIERYVARYRSDPMMKPHEGKCIVRGEEVLSL